MQYFIGIAVFIGTYAAVDNTINARTFKIFIFRGNFNFLYGNKLLSFYTGKDNAVTKDYKGASLLSQAATF